MPRGELFHPSMRTWHVPNVSPRFNQDSRSCTGVRITRTHGRIHSRFCRTSAEKKNAGDNQDDELDGSAAPRNTLVTAEAMVPVEADFDSDGD